MRKRLLCQTLPKPHQPVPLLEEEAHHALKVFRLRDGDLVEAIDGNGHQALVMLKTRGGAPRLEYTAPEALEGEATQPLRGASVSMPLTLEMAILKGEAMEWVIEKAVELGVDEVVPIVTEYTVVQLKNKGPEAFQERWQRIADQSLKQCGRLNRMKIHLPLSFEQRLQDSASDRTSVRLWCDEKSEAVRRPLWDWLENEGQPNRILALIGPEGGWSPHERSLLLSTTVPQTVRVELGPLILRAETAAIYTLSLMNARFQRTSIRMK